MEKLENLPIALARFNRRTLLAAAGGGLALITVHGGSTQGSKPTVRIGSKDFTEQLLVGEMAAALLEDAGYKVDRKLNLGGTAVVHQALVNGDIDAYVEYTGTGLLAILKLPIPTMGGTPAAAASASPSPEMAGTPAASSIGQAVYDIVKSEYKKQFDLVWLDSWGFNDTYTLALRADKAAELGAKTISDLKGKADKLVFGATQEFLTRPDGLPGLDKAYGFEFKDAKGFDPGLLYQAVDSKQVDIISAFATDGRIPALKLVTLVDDLHFFPPYFAAPVVRQDLLTKAPDVATVLNKLSGKIGDSTMAGLNLQVDQDKKDPGDVAHAFLQQQGLIKK